MGKRSVVSGPAYRALAILRDALADLPASSASAHTELSGRVAVFALPGAGREPVTPPFRETGRGYPTSHRRTWLPWQSGTGTYDHD